MQAQEHSLQHVKGAIPPLFDQIFPICYTFLKILIFTIDNLFLLKSEVFSFSCRVITKVIAKVKQENWMTKRQFLYLLFPFSFSFLLSHWNCRLLAEITICSRRIEENIWEKGIIAYFIYFVTSYNLSTLWLVVG